MAHFAEINQDNIVVRVLVVPNEQEHRGQDFLANDLKLGGKWVQTSYNSNIRANYAGIGFTYNKVYDVFIPPQSQEDATLNTETWSWETPYIEVVYELEPSGSL